MIIDFHTHVKISKKSTFMPDYFDTMIQEASESGLHALALTEHFNTIRFFDIYDYLDEHYSYQDGYYHVHDVRVFPGIEVDVKEGGHILLIADRKTIKWIRKQLDSHVEPEQFMPFDSLMDLIEGMDVLKIGAHPFRESTPLAKNITKQQMKKLDALDLNGKDLYAKGSESCKAELISYADEVNLPVVAGSDTHQFLQYGIVGNDFKKDCTNVEMLKASIKANAYELQIADDLFFRVKAAVLVKKYMKKAIIKEEVSI
ncbi:PHP domain-containing protein [Saliterribacillus persicus]|uniref:PHP domain-containing protein n=1 Tax=Saliterribacillus persicus TaxID=930114 RepID=A0A368YG72_9BACI|nr:PHP domain-containing protein [Saliterribacillus persicus]RCW77184.1 hypothetical protein DFR57_10151 [Saliterribacillus persicus]